MFFKKTPGSVSWMIVFLGNPGANYTKTRHNVGFLTADVIEKNAGIRINRLRFKALTGSGVFAGEKVLLIKPQTFMNLSGDAVSQAMRFFRLPLTRVIVVSDDVSLPIGKIRIRRSGSAGGHNGLKDIIAKCGGEDFPRIKIGVGEPPHPAYDMADWVLSVFTDKEAQLISEAVKDAANSAETIISAGIDKAMNIYN